MEYQVFRLSIVLFEVPIWNLKNSGSSEVNRNMTKLAELKIQILREATMDAKKRAEEIASSSGNKIGVIRTAKMGVFQITPVNSYDVSDYGSNDTSSLEKKVNAVVKADFSIV